MYENFDNHFAIKVNPMQSYKRQQSSQNPWVVIHYVKDDWTNKKIYEKRE